MVLKIDKIPLVKIVISAASSVISGQNWNKILITYLSLCGFISIFQCVCISEGCECACVSTRLGKDEVRTGTIIKNTHPVVVRAVNVSGHAKVSYLDQQVLSYQAVPGCQVSVDKVLGGQVDHASSNLLGNVQHLGLCELHQDAVLTVCH